jgi:hypothetical protein
MNALQFYKEVVQAFDQNLRSAGLKRRPVSGYSGRAVWVREIDPPPPFPQPERIVFAVEYISKGFGGSMGTMFRIDVERGARENLRAFLVNSQRAQLDDLRKAIIERSAAPVGHKRRILAATTDARVDMALLFFRLRTCAITLS